MKKQTKTEVKLDPKVKAAFNKVKKDVANIRTAIKIGYGLTAVVAIALVISILL